MSTDSQPTAPKKISLDLGLSPDADDVMHRLASNFGQVKDLLEENRQLMRQFLQVKGVFQFNPTPGPTPASDGESPAVAGDSAP